MARNDIGLMVGTLFLVRDIAHREHLRATGPGSYATHSALGDFYTGIIPLVDSLVECYQGRFEELIDIPLVTNTAEDGAPLEALTQQREWIRSVRYSAVPKDETAIQNIIDEIEALYMSTIYKLKFLS